MRPTQCIIQALEVSPTCPIDRAPLRLPLVQAAPRIIYQMVDELLVYCPHRPLGCKTTCQRHLLATHLKDECSWSEMGCAFCAREPGAAGGRRVRKRDMDKHLSECPHRLEECSTGCGANVKVIDQDRHTAHDCPAVPASCPHCSLLVVRSGLPAHFLICASHPIPCPHARFGCTYIGPRRSVEDEHLLTCAYEGVKDFLLRFEDRMDTVDYENRTLKRRVEEAERREEKLSAVLEGCRLSLGPYYYSVRSLTGHGPSHLMSDHARSSASSEFVSARNSASNLAGLDLAFPNHSLDDFPSGVASQAARGPPAMPERRSSLANGGPEAPSPTETPDAHALERMVEAAEAAGGHSDQPSWHTGPFYPNVPPRVSSRTVSGEPTPPATSRSQRRPDVGSAFPDAYTPVSAFPSPRTQRQGHSLAVPTSPSADANSPLLGFDEHSVSGGSAGLHLSQPGTLTSTLASLASSLHSLSHQCSTAELRASNAAVNETLRLQDEVSLLRATLHGVRMNLSMLMMDRERRGEGGFWMPSGAGGPAGSQAGPSSAPGAGPGGRHSEDGDDMMPRMRPGLAASMSLDGLMGGMALDEMHGGPMGRRWGQPPPPGFAHSMHHHPLMPGGPPLGQGGYMGSNPAMGPYGAGGAGMWRRMGRPDMKL